MRGQKAKKRIMSPDPIFKSRVVTRTINKVMLHGEKAVAEGIVYSAIGSLAEDAKEALKMFEDAVKNVMPKQEVRSRRVGGATYQVPFPTKHERAEALAVRWIVDCARSRSGKPMHLRLVDELRNANSGIGDAIKKRDETHKMADANKAFSHFKF
ncbi:30S ribosomal protein S7 [candidate division WWE3 bacterium]|nr:30S ribosomal protein S7 [candidate division WWE3 bacterium]